MLLEGPPTTSGMRCGRLVLKPGEAAMQNIYVICEAMGLGRFAGSYTSFGNGGPEAEVRVRLNISPTHIIVGSMAIGRSSQLVCDIPRDPPETRYGVN